MSVIWSQFCIEKSRWERESCPLSGIEKRPPLGGYVSIKVMQSVTLRSSAVERLSSSRRVRYRRLDCNDIQNVSSESLCSVFRTEGAVHL